MEPLYALLRASGAPRRALSRRTASEDAGGPPRALLDPVQVHPGGDGVAEAEGVGGGDVDGDADALAFGDQCVGLAAGASAELALSHRRAPARCGR